MIEREREREKNETKCICLIHWNVEVSVKCGSYNIGVVGGQRGVSLGGGLY